MNDLNDLPQLLQRLAAKLIQKKAKVTCAESCTAGLVSAALTTLSGSSSWFDMGFATYSNDAKKQLLDVRQTTLDQFGAVSLETVEEMAAGALSKASANYALAVSGVAGPTGGSEEKPVGTVCFALASTDTILTTTVHFQGERASVREQSVYFILNWLDTMLDDGF